MKKITIMILFLIIISLIYIANFNHLKISQDENVFYLEIPKRNLMSDLIFENPYLSAHIKTDNLGNRLNLKKGDWVCTFLTIKTEPTISYKKNCTPYNGDTPIVIPKDFEKKDTDNEVNLILQVYYGDRQFQTKVSEDQKKSEYVRNDDISSNYEGKHIITRAIREIQYK